MRIPVSPACGYRWHPARPNECTKTEKRGGVNEMVAVVANRAGTVEVDFEMGVEYTGYCVIQRTKIL